MDSEMSLQKRWVAFGPIGAVGSIQQEDDGFAVRMVGEDEPRGIYPTTGRGEGRRAPIHAARVGAARIPRTLSRVPELRTQCRTELSCTEPYRGEVNNAG